MKVDMRTSTGTKKGETIVQPSSIVATKIERKLECGDE